MDTEPRISEILDAINSFAQSTEDKFSHLENRFDHLESDVSSIKSDVSSLKSDVSSLKSDVNYLKAEMVTKDYLDRKLGSLRGDLVILLRQENAKLAALITGMQEQKLIPVEMANRILSMEPFPHLSV